MKTYNQIIRDLREDKDLTQSEIAEILEIRYNVYQRYELGTAKMPIHHLIKLAKYYNVSTDYILGLTDSPTPPQKKNADARQEAGKPFPFQARL